ncbi:MAG: translesion error-prone DNA polymerase V autoproteolytic subunit [Candidatus Omnitrophica bacterium]|nr:translesion error-prone DNA polymerase V autoproteolytic subunit [Candidatus Omnitrophota bacterium]
MKIATVSVLKPAGIPFYATAVSAGFPSPADDFIESNLDWNEYLVRHPAATFCVRAKGDSMINAGIFSGSIMIVDRALYPRQDSIVVAVLDGEFTVKHIRREQGRVVLYPDNPAYQPVEIASGRDFSVWGVVTHVIRTFA